MVNESRQPQIPLTEAIRRRTSCRAYNGLPLAPEHLIMLKGIARSAPRLNAAPVRFAFLEGVEQTEAILSGLVGSYGRTRGAPLLLAGIAGPGQHRGESLGYTMEWLILEATRHNIGSCWMSGTFDRQRLAGKIALEEGEEVLAVSPLGYPSADADSALSQKLVKTLVGANKRKPLRDIVFADYWGNSAEALLVNRPDLQRMAEAIRLAPSAVNRQPWRLILTPSMAVLASVSKRSGLDNGIALCHWTIAAHEEGLSGVWDLNPDREALREALRLPAKMEIIGIYPL
jgi:nitroreductase